VDAEVSFSQPPEEKQHQWTSCRVLEHCR